MILRPLDREALRQQYLQASPFPFVKIEQFIDPVFAAEVAAAFPSWTKRQDRARPSDRSTNEEKSRSPMQNFSRNQLRR